MSDEQSKAERRFESFELRDIGVRMHHWHGSQNDPIYAVGSFFFDGDDYPDLDVVAQAKSGLECCLRAFDGTAEKAALNRWGDEEKEELEELVQFLDEYLSEKGYKEEDVNG